MPRSILHVVLAALAAAPVVAAADAPVLWTSAQMRWTDVAEPAGARHAVLWGDAATGDRGTLVRWKFNTKNPPRSDAHDTHFVVLAGTFTLALDGMEEKQFGPGGFVAIPRGTRYTAGCEAAGECIFVMHAAGAAPATR